MQNNKERWVALCEQAAIEIDSTKLIALTNEIIRLLTEKQDRLDHTLKNGTKDGQS